MYGLHFGVVLRADMSAGCERPVVLAVDGQHRRVSLVGLKGELSKEVVDSELCRQGAMAVPEIRSCQRRRPPELRHRTAWRCPSSLCLVLFAASKHFAAYYLSPAVPSTVQ